MEVPFLSYLFHFSAIKMLKTVVLFINLLLLVVSSTALTLDQESNNENFRNILETVLTVAHDTVFDSHLFTEPASIVIGPFIINVTRKDFNRIEDLNSTTLRQFPLSAAPISKLNSPFHPELPFPIIPNFNLVVAKIGTLDYHILGLLPKTEAINSEFIWVDNIEIPEEVQLILVLPTARVLPNSFQFLVVAPKSDLLPRNAQIVKYNFPRLRSSKGFFNPINSHLVAVPFLSIYSNCTSYFGLGLLPNSHSLLSSAFSPQQIQQVQPVQPVTPYSLDNRLSASSRSLQQLQTNDYIITGIERAKILLGKQYPLLLTSKSSSLHPNYLPYNVTLPHHEEMPQLLNDFQIVAKIDEDLWVPPFFYPLVFVSASQLVLSDNEIKLHMFVNITEGDESTGTTPFQVVMLRNPYENYMPSYPYYIMCIVPKIRWETSLPTNRIVADSPTTQPTFVSNTTKNTERTKPVTVATITESN